MEYRTRSPLRLLAPAALAIFGVVFLIVLFGASGGEEETTDGAGDAQLGDDGGAETPTSESTPKRYTVEAGDTLDGIAAENGVDVDEIEALNPDLDPQALETGEKIKLRE